MLDKWAAAFQDTKAGLLLGSKDDGLLLDIGTSALMDKGVTGGDALMDKRMMDTGADALMGKEAMGTEADASMDKGSAELLSMEVAVLLSKVVALQRSKWNASNLDTMVLLAQNMDKCGCQNQNKMQFCVSCFLDQGYLVHYHKDPHKSHLPFLVCNTFSSY